MYNRQDAKDAENKDFALPGQTAGQKVSPDDSGWS
jgi:hypothetical protein